MPAPVANILAEIVARKRRTLAARLAPLGELERRAALLKRRSFAQALVGDPPVIIAEIKRASPSRGRLVEDLDPARLAQSYARGGAAALSVLTEADFFGGSFLDLEQARSAVALPVLRKDFILDEYDIAESASHGADAILLIAAIHSAEALRRLREYAAGLGLAALVEVHDREELLAALDSGAAIIGVNNRDLRSFQIRLETSLELAPLIPPTVAKVSESGIHSAEHVRRLSEAGFTAFLVGEHLVRAPDPSSAIKALRSCW